MPSFTFGLASASRTKPARVLGIAVERLAEEALFVAECGIEARRIDAHGRGEVGDARALVALAPEHFERPLERLIHVESARAANCRGLDSHICSAH
jgi:hypothetical protein